MAEEQQLNVIEGVIGNTANWVFDHKNRGGIGSFDLTIRSNSIRDRRSRKSMIQFCFFFSRSDFYLTNVKSLCGVW